MSVDHVGAMLPRDGQGGPELGLQVVGHDRQTGHLAHDVDTALRHPTVRQIDRQLHRETHDVHAVEALADGH